MVSSKLTSDGQYFWSTFQTRLHNLNDALIKGQKYLEQNRRNDFLTQLREARSQVHDMEACLAAMTEAERL